MKTLPAGIITEKNKLASDNPWLWLLHLRPSGTEDIFLTTDNENVSYDGETWITFPFKVGISTEDATGSLARITITVANRSREIASIIDRNRGFVDRKVTLHYGSRNQSSGVFTEAFSQTFRVQAVAEDENRVSFSLGNDNLEDYPFPSKTLDRARCAWSYSRDGTGMCQYKGTLDASPVYSGGGSGTMTDPVVISGVKTEAWAVTYVSAGPHWTVVGTKSGAQSNAPASGAYSNGIWSSTFGGSPNDGDSFDFSTTNLPTCARNLRGSNGCEEHENQARFGGAPGIPKELRA